MEVIRKSLFSLLMVGFLLGLLNVVAWTQLKADIYNGDPAYFWMLKSNLDQQIDNGQHPFRLVTNDLGFRDEPLDGRERWLFLGCSTTLGWGVDVEDTFLFQLQEQLSFVDIVNGGQPGWSTAQVLLNIESFQALKPTRVFVGLGVRDAQKSMKVDKEATPSPWLVQTHLFKWLQQRKKVPADTDVDNSAMQFRVAPLDYSTALSEIVSSFPDAEVVLYQFPQVDFSTAHSQVLMDMGGVSPSQFPKKEFFEDDPIHLTPNGHQRLAEWFMTTLVTNQDR